MDFPGSSGFRGILASWLGLTVGLFSALIAATSFVSFILIYFIMSGEKQRNINAVAIVP